jgi:hypothetical protein
VSVTKKPKIRAVRRPSAVFVAYEWLNVPRTLKVFASRERAARFVKRQTWPKNWRIHRRTVTR